MAINQKGKGSIYRGIDLKKTGTTPGTFGSFIITRSGPLENRRGKNDC